MTPSITPQLEKAIERCVGVKDPVERVIAVRRLVEELTDGRERAGNAYAAAMFDAQRAHCSCGEGFSQSADMKRHLATHEGHEMLDAGVSYGALAERIGVNAARVQQLISKGRALREGALTNGARA